MTNALAICKAGNGAFSDVGEAVTLNDLWNAQAPATDVSELEVMGDRGAQQPQQPLMLGGGPEHYLVLPERLCRIEIHEPPSKRSDGCQLPIFFPNS